MKYLQIKKIENLNNFTKLDNITIEQYDQIKRQAQDEYNQIKSNNLLDKTMLNFNNEICFISSCDALHGFYFPNAPYTTIEKKYRLKLLCIAFKRKYNFDLQQYEDFVPVPIFEDVNENYFILNYKDLDFTQNNAYNRIIAQVKNNIKCYRDEIDALEKINILTKKDGKPFANYRQNFENCRIDLSEANYPKLFFRGGNFFNLYKLITTEKEREQAIKENRAILINGSCRYDSYILTFDEIKNEIKNEINNRKRWIIEKENYVKNLSYYISDIAKNYIDFLQYCEYQNIYKFIDYDLRDILKDFSIR